MSAADSLVRSECLVGRGAELVSKARALRQESQALRRGGESLRFEQRRLMREFRRQNEAASAQAKPQLFVPSPWSSLVWQPASEDFDGVLVPVP